MYSRVVASIMNMCSGFSLSFCTPDGAMKMWFPWRMDAPPPVPVT